jgi:hypothetical protein
MRYAKNLKRLLKIAQNGSVEAWQEVKAEAESDELPPGFQTDGLENTAAAAEKLTEKANEAKKVISGLSAEEKQVAQSIISSEKFLNAARVGSKVLASTIADTILIKSGSRYMLESEITEIVREINLYKNLNPIQVKVASGNDFEIAYFERISAFNMMLSDSEFLKTSSILKISRRYSPSIIKEADLSSGLKSLWSGTKGMLGKTLGLFSRLLPFGFIIWGFYDLYQGYKKEHDAIEELKSTYSDLGNEDLLLDAGYISKLITEHKNDPETMLRIVRLNKIATFCKKNWYAQIWAAALIGMEVVGLIITGLTGGAFAFVMGLLKSMLMGAAIFGPVATGFFNAGTEDYVQNLTRIATIADYNIDGAAPDTTNTAEESGSPSASDEEALEMFEKLKGNMANKA